MGGFFFCPCRHRVATAKCTTERHDHARQQGSLRHHHQPDREGPRQRRRLAARHCHRNGIEDGLIWVYGFGEDDVQAFTEPGIENLIGTR